MHHPKTRRWNYAGHKAASLGRAYLDPGFAIGALLERIDATPSVQKVRLGQPVKLKGKKSPAKRGIVKVEVFDERSIRLHVVCRQAKQYIDLICEDAEAAQCTLDIEPVYPKAIHFAYDPTAYPEETYLPHAA
jgi:hypothetical protein